MKVFAATWKSLLLAMMLMGWASASEKVDINSADAGTLDRVLVNIGAAKAQAIVDYRQANGPFRSAEELALVKGIGLATIERNREVITVGSAEESTRKAAPVPRR